MNTTPFRLHLNFKLLMYVFVLLLSVIPNQKLFSQKDRTVLTLVVLVEEEEEQGIEGATVKLFEKGSLINSITTSKDGNAVFKLKGNTEYTIEISKPEYVTKIASINTKIPDYENQSFEQVFPTLLFKPCKGLDYSLLSNPVVKLVYNDLKRDFLPEKAYDNVMRDKLHQLLDNNDKCIEEEYQSIVRKADREFAEKKYLDAQATYTEANKKRPDDKYVIDRLKEIEKLLAQQKDADKTYKDYIAQADKQFNAKNYPLAKEFYKRALNLKPGEAYPASQIAAIDALMAQKDKEEKDRQAADAQKAQQEQARQAQLAQEAEAKKAQAAKEEKDRKEQEALAQAKAEQERKAQLEKEKQDKLAQQAKLEKEEQEKEEKEARFSSLIKQGDNSLNNDVCGKALQSYRDALAEKPNDPTALKKISEAEAKCKEIQAKAAKDKSTRDAYNLAIAEADKQFGVPNYSKARENYEKALNLLPDEEYPAKKLKEIDNLLKAAEKEELQRYKKLMSDANKAFDNEELATAKDLFGQIVKMRPDDQYSKDKIQTIESILAEQKRLAEERKAKLDQYNKIIADADAAFKKPDLNAARSSYQKALALLPSESYPKQKLSEIENLEKEQQQKLERDFNAKIQSGDRNFATKNYDQAIKDYQDALKIKPGESYPTQRIDDINKLLAEQARLNAEKKAKQDAYNAAITKADNLVKSQQYDQALVAYKEASSYKPDEQYPYNKIDEINKIKKQQQLDESYKKAIASANSFFDQKKYEQSKSYYAQALEFKPGDPYATDQIAKADAAIADQIKKLADAKARQDAYDKAMADADKYFATKDYEMAKTSYQTALSIFADKPLPKQKIADIDKLLKEKKRNEDYKSIIDEANALYTAGNYEQAKEKYKAAALVKPEETSTADKIKEIDKLLAQKAAEKQKQEQTEKNYNDAIKRANDLFDKAQYDAAKKEYEAAVLLMPNENYPKQKIAKINEITRLLAKETKQPAASAKEDKTKAGGKIIADLAFKNDSERDLYLKDLITKYPEGITCEVYKESNRVVTRYIIIRENQANEFREIKYSWGTDYTRNGKPITYLYFTNQIRSRVGEYFNKTEM